MPIDITINDISGQTPYDIYVCDTGSTYCVYAATINYGDLPYTFQVPIVYSNNTSVNLRIIDDNECEINQILIV